MITFISILSAAILLYLIVQVLTSKMYELKQTPHQKTPENLGLDFEEIRFSTENQCMLYGWWIPTLNKPKTAPTLILVHGWSRNLGRMLRYIEHLHPQYNLLAFDARHHGSSDLDNHSSMYKFGQDTHAAVNEACRREIDPNQIGVIGLSIGGAGSVYAAAINPCIKKVVTVGAPAHPVDVMKREFKRYHIPTFVAWLLLKQIESKIGVSYESFAPVNNISKADASFLIIHGKEDEVILPSQGEKLYHAARSGQATLWSIPGRGHSNCHHEPGFWDRLDSFFKYNSN